MSSKYDDSETPSHNGSNIVELNIGGVYFTTAKTTLLRYEDSMLALIVSENYPTYKDKEGRLFIDRDATLFIHILNYLRTNKLIINDLNNNDYSHDNLNLSINKLLNLKIEADFYRIDNLISDIDVLLMVQREKLAKISVMNDNKFNYYQLQVQNLQAGAAAAAASTAATVKDEGYHLELIEHNFLNTNTKCLQIIAHYDVFKMLPLMKDDLDLIETAKQTIDESQQSQIPHKLQDRHCWYLGNDCFEIQNVSYLTRTQLGHILLQMNSKLLHSNIAYLNSVNNSAYNLSIFDKWFIQKDLVGKYLSNIGPQQKALPPGRTVGYIDWDPQSEN
jgi:hypothetical protein